MTQQPDGKVVLAGTIQRYDIPGLSGDHFLVVRLNPDGTLDDTFDGDGWVSMDLDALRILYHCLEIPDYQEFAITAIEMAAKRSLEMKAQGVTP